jgi:tRNA (guanine6-N2)-methyltransferase
LLKQWQIELEVPEGLEDISIEEVKQHLRPITPKLIRAGILTFDYADDLRKLRQLRSVYASYIVLDFAVPRPKALLGHQFFTEIVETCRLILKTDHFQTVTLNAAGSDSSVMRRILDEIGDATGLTPNSDDGDLLIRIRKAKNNWQVVIRTTARPLSARKWRIYDYQGALNAPTAYAMNKLIPQDHHTHYANLMCGSGTLLIERDHNRQLAYGIDINSHALNLTQQHILEAQVTGVQLLHADVTRAPFSDNSFDAITCDLPFGQLVGSHAENQALYPLILREMQRILAKNGIAVIITHEVRLLEKIIPSQGWHIKQARKVNLRGLHPRIYVLEK